MKKLTTPGIAALAFALCALPTAWAGNADKHFKKMDTDGDGKVTRTEHAAAAKQMFAECDANSDGIVTAEEMDSYHALKGEKPGKHDKTSAQKIQVLDQNADGRLTAAEHETGAAKMFDATDKNGDGVLTKAECDAAEKALKKNT